MLNLADLICTSRAAACSKNTFGNNYIIPLNINAIVINGARIKHPLPLYATHLLKYIISGMLAGRPGLMMLLASR